MGDLSGDIANSVYQRTVATLTGKVSMSGKMLELLMLTDGHTTLQAIATKMNISLSELRPLLSKLMAYGLVEEAQESTDLIPPQFYSYVVGQLSRITGPIAQVMVEDAVAQVSNGTAHVPLKRADALIEMLGRQIPDENQKALFIKTMLEKLQGV